jgi:hypothetical protein
MRVGVCALLGLFLWPTISPAAGPMEGGYAVVVSKATNDDPQWAKVVQALVAKHQAKVVTYNNKVAESVEPLKKIFPRYACFVARPEEVGRRFVIDVHQFTRRLDDDPYTDVLWAILTGYSADDALRIVNNDKPLSIRKAAAGTGINLDLFDEGVWYSEGEKGACFEKKPGGKVEKKKCPDDSTKSLVDMFNDYQPELFLTSGHATDRDWQIGYSYKNGQFRCKDGVLFGKDLQGTEHPVQSKNPKIYLASGNCLMGLIRDKQSIALAWMGSAGVDQLVGYVVSTWYGRGGWGTRDWFFGEPGRYTLAEAFYFNNQTIVRDIQNRFPQAADKHIADFERFGVPMDFGKVLEEIHKSKGQGEVKECLGLVWDRDTVALYGDPAWDVRLASHGFPYDWRLTEKNGVYTLELTAKDDCRPASPPSMFLPHRVQDVVIIEGKDMQPLVTDNFIMVTSPGELKKGKTARVVFKAKKAAS